ncbi:hypothetical protein H6F42_06925 [Pseudanabaena sp. FACHB-1998]|uniref:hypothetical protein n=1 Tax=Pseudanabaena sp. FACHB-1998 TaxID=2692858 RepID=UPI00168102F9|nr:hypothetical protein [Pseudanabaena sp. FACHB-1998]MBD2176647.1 hypothetical protein [Pseudanabaena sp. FACHB-1998]
MASRTLVKTYLAQWMQMGKAVHLPQQNKEVYIHKIIQGEKYSPVFNKLWDEISTAKAQEAYLNGTSQTISDLLSNQWEIIPCARCSLLVPCLDMGARVPISCPCDDLVGHPNLESIAPRQPVKTLSHLDNLCDRLDQKLGKQDEDPNENASDSMYTSEDEDNQAIRNLRNSILRLVKTTL